jgi:hypothetical protein
MVPSRGRTLSGRGPAGRTVFITSPQQFAVAVSRTLSLDYATTPTKVTPSEGHPNKTAALPCGRRRESITETASVLTNALARQPLRRLSVVRFHCATLSAIMRVDFIAAWLSWA